MDTKICLDFTEHGNHHLKAEMEMIRSIGRGCVGLVCYADEKTAETKRQSILQKLRGTELKARITRIGSRLEVKRL